MIPSEYESYWDNILEETTDFRKYKPNEEIVIYDLPRKHGNLHGSSVSIRCPNDKPHCDITTELIIPTDRRILNILVSDIKSFGECVIEDIHEHRYPIPSYHVHGICSVSINDVDDILRYIRWL